MQTHIYTCNKLIINLITDIQVFYEVYIREFRIRKIFCTDNQFNKNLNKNVFLLTFCFKKNKILIIKVFKKLFDELMILNS